MAMPLRAASILWSWNRRLINFSRFWEHPMNNPYDIIKSRRVTEKSRVLENLQHAKSNPSLAKCNSPKAVFNVNPKANKTQIAWAVEQIYADKKVKVTAVNT